MRDGRNRGDHPAALRGARRRKPCAACRNLARRRHFLRRPGPPVQPPRPLHTVPHRRPGSPGVHPDGQARGMARRGPGCAEGRQDLRADGPAPSRREERADPAGCPGRARAHRQGAPGARPRDLARRDPGCRRGRRGPALFVRAAGSHLLPGPAGLDHLHVRLHRSAQGRRPDTRKRPALRCRLRGPAAHHPGGQVHPPLLARRQRRRTTCSPLCSTEPRSTATTSTGTASRGSPRGSWRRSRPSTRRTGTRTSPNWIAWSGWPDRATASSPVTTRSCSRSSPQRAE